MPRMSTIPSFHIRRSLSTVIVALACVALGAPACTGRTEADTGVDAAPDVATDITGNDASDVSPVDAVDAVVDVSVDAMGDTGADAPLDVPADSQADVVNDTGIADGGLAARCTSTGGALATGLCCASTGDFPNSCLTGACGCAPSSSHTVMTCQCATGCFDPAVGCR